MHMDNRPFHFLTLSFLLRLFTSNCPIDHAQLASEVDVREFLAPPQVADVFEEDIDSDYSLSDSDSDSRYPYRFTSSRALRDAPVDFHISYYCTYVYFCFSRGNSPSLSPRSMFPGDLSPFDVSGAKFDASRYVTPTRRASLPVTVFRHLSLSHPSVFLFASQPF